MIEGYAEKGEQNPMILGYQRAIGVKETMVKKGIDSNRIRVISLANNSYNAIHAHEHDANMKMTLTTIDFVKTYKNK